MGCLKICVNYIFETLTQGVAETPYGSITWPALLSTKQY